MACFDKWDIGACGCIVPTYLVTCKGCNSSLLTSYDIDVWDHSGGTLLYTLTTNASGVISLAAGTYWVISHDGRFAGQNITIVSGTRTVFFAANTTAGYQCTAFCPLPFATIFASDTYFAVSGAALTWNAATGVFQSGLIAYSFPGCAGSCAARNINIYLSVFATSTFPNLHFAFPASGIHGCPDPAGSFGGPTWYATIGSQFGLTLNSCRPLSASKSDTAGVSSGLICAGANDTSTITE